MLRTHIGLIDRNCHAELPICFLLAEEWFESVSR
jgi:hypothetical protein